MSFTSLSEPGELSFHLLRSLLFIGISTLSKNSILIAVACAGRADCLLRLGDGHGGRVALLRYRLGYSDSAWVAFFGHCGCYR